MSNETFWSWFSTEAEHLQELDPDALATRIGEALQSHVGELGVEIADEAEEDGSLEVIVTAHRKAQLFPTVKALIAGAPALAGWHFVALKPATGFDVTLEVEGVELEGASLRFSPVSGPEGLGLTIYLPEATAAEEDVEALLWLLLEAGVGEEALAGVTRVEAAPHSAPAAKDAQPVSELAGFLAVQASRAS